MIKYTDGIIVYGKMKFWTKSKILSFYFESTEKWSWI